MTKPQYNQGDLIRYSRLSSLPHLLVITEVFTGGYTDDDTFYRVKWLDGDKYNRRAQEVYHINSLDDNKHFNLLAQA